MKRLAVLIAVIGLSLTMAAAQSGAQSVLRFPSGKSSQSIRFNNELGLVFVRLSVNGSEPLWFNLDTGYDVSIIDTTLAKRLKLKIENARTINAPGGKIETGDISGVDLNIRGVEVRSQPMQTVPLREISKFVGHEFAGILGHDFLKLFAIEIDYDRDILTFHKPESFRYDGKGESLPVEIIAGEPFLYLNVLPEEREPIRAKLKIDTGGISGLGFNKNFVEANDLPGKNQIVRVVTGVAVGGGTKDVMFRLKGFQVGTYVLKNLIAGATIDSAGFENRNDAGTFGAEILMRFKVVLDYSRKRICFEPGVTFSEPFEIDKAGLFFTAEGRDYKTLKIYSVLPDSAGAEAGFQIGDAITDVNGTSAAKLSVVKLWSMMRGAEGTVYRIGISRGGKRSRVELKLRALL